MLAAAAVVGMGLAAAPASAGSLDEVPAELIRLVETEGRMHAQMAECEIDTFKYEETLRSKLHNAWLDDRETAKRVFRQYERARTSERARIGACDMDRLEATVARWHGQLGPAKDAIFGN